MKNFARPERAIFFERGSFCLLLCLAAGGCGRHELPGEPGAGAGTAGGAALDEVLARVEELSRDEQFQDAIRLLNAQAPRFTGEALRSLEVSRVRCLLESRSAVQAERGLQALEAVGPDDPRLLLLRGEMERQLSRFAAAKESLRLGLARLPGDPDGTLSLARTLYRLDEAAESVKRFEEWLRAVAQREGARGREIEDVRLELGRALAQAGRFTDAADAFAHLLESRPMESQLYSELARTQYRLGRRDAGRFLQEIYGRISQLDYQKLVEDRLIESGQVVFGLGQRAFNFTLQKRFLEAFRAYERARELETSDSRAHAYSAALALQFNRPSDALEIVREGLRKNLMPRSGLLFHQGAALEARKESDAAEAAYRQAEEALRREGDLGGPERGQAAPLALVLRRAGLALDRGAREDALLLAGEAARLAPQAWEPPYHRGKALLALGRPREALMSLEEASARAGTEPPLVAAARARALIALEDSARAGGLLMEVLQRHPASPEAQDALAEAAARGFAAPEGFQEARARRVELAARLEALRARIDGRPLDVECGNDFIEEGKVLLQLRRSAEALDALLFGVDLAPENIEGCRLIIAGLARNEDVFLRLRFLHRLLRLDPGDAGANQALAAIYLKLRVRLDDALAAAERLRGLKPGEEADRLAAAIRAAIDEAKSAAPK